MSSITIILGATASGKSQLLEPILKTAPLTFIGCDSVHLYRELLIGSTRPTPEELQGAHSACIGSVSIRERVNAAYYRDAALEATQQAHSRGDRIVVCGGSAFYFSSVFLGLAPVPLPNPLVRNQVAQLYDDNPQKAYELMCERDPGIQNKIHLNDRYRVIRALEVMLETQKPWSELQHMRSQSSLWEEAKIYFIHTDSALLRERIHARTDDMLARGWIDEIELLLQQGYALDCPGFQVTGYAQITEWVKQGKTESLESLSLKIKNATWQLARKQNTFLRGLSKKPEVARNLTWLPMGSGLP